MRSLEKTLCGQVTLLHLSAGSETLFALLLKARNQLELDVEKLSLKFGHKDQQLSKYLYLMEVIK